MAGFFSSHTANALTSWTGHYLDWSRVGELIAQGTHRYSTKELLQRGFVLVSSAYGAYWAYDFAEEGFGLGAGLYSMAGCFVGFVASHIVVLAPLIYKRYQMSEQCSVYQNNILLMLQDMRELDKDNDKIDQLILTISGAVDRVMGINLSDDLHARASQTWGARRSLMEKISNKINEDVLMLRKEKEGGLLEVKLDKLNEFWTEENTFTNNYTQNSIHS